VHTKSRIAVRHVVMRPKREYIYEGVEMQLRSQLAWSGWCPTGTVHAGRVRPGQSSSSSSTFLSINIYYKAGCQIEAEALLKIKRVA
jgi:hypothetical protein